MPDKTKHSAVIGFIVAHPDTRLCNRATLKAQPDKTNAPATIANAAATKENLLKTRSTDAGSRFLISKINHFSAPMSLRRSSCPWGGEIGTIVIFQRSREESKGNLIDEDDLGETSHRVGRDGAQDGALRRPHPVRGGQRVKVQNGFAGTHGRGRLARTPLPLDMASQGVHDPHYPPARRLWFRPL
jgi:hypothetical protein